jgi:2-octaprenyl-6-methoxyphenol hydroxylase
MVLAQHSVTPADSPLITYDVAIAGAGIAGLTLACALKNSGLRVALIETNPRTAGLHQRRAYHLSLMTGRIFQGLGIWHHILPHITTFNQITLADADYAAVVDLRPEDLGTQNLGYVGEHRVLVRALLDALESSDIHWICPAEVVRVEYVADGAVLDSAIATLQDGTQIRTRLLVAADGARSPLRQQAGIKTHGWKYWQSCVTAVIRPEKSHGDIAREHFWESGPFATLPLPDNRCQVVLTAPHAEAQRWAEGDEAAFLAELDRRYGGQLGQLELVSDRRLFPVQLMQSDRYISPRLALVGDAAHCCHPVGGQGLNLGIRDVAALAQVLQTAHRQGQDLGSLAVLKRYERWRKLENLVVLGFTDFLDRSFSSNWLPLVVLRRLGLRVMRVARPLKFVALRLMTGTGGKKPELSIQTLEQTLEQ